MAGTSLPNPRASDFSRGTVTDPNQSEVTRAGFYDSNLYVGAGQQQLSFFVQQAGQGVTSEPGAVVGSAKTLFDTNLQISASLPSGKAYQPQQIEVYFWPGLSAAANTFTITNPSVFAAANAAVVADQVADIYTFYSAGRLQLGVLDKVYCDEAPLSLFPVQTGVVGDFAMASTSATAGEIAVLLARATGRPYEFGIPFTLSATQNFWIYLLWAGLLALPSGFNARVKVRMDGYFLRATQ
jgi:hypothetical protein